MSFGAAGAAISGSTLTVTQSTSKAILNWADFNIANGYKVNFVQPSSSSEALNRIWSADPSRIAGSLTANGQVYLINQNGIIFDKGAQVDVGSLTASTLGISDSLFESGILSQSNSNSIDQITGNLPAVFASDPGTAGTVTVNQGAVIKTADGGRIMLLGTAVTNAGTLTTPDGQTILAAGNKVYLAASSDPAMRGLLVEVDAGGGAGKVIDAATQQEVAVGTVTNAAKGQVSADRGNITVAGMIVNQQGLLSATTSVSANGSIFLVAGDTSGTDESGNEARFYNSAVVNSGFGTLAPTKGGTLTLAKGSTTEVLADSTDKGTISEGNLANDAFNSSQVKLVSGSVTMLGGSSIVAPGAAVDVIAASNPFFALANPGVGSPGTGQIYLDSGSVIDVSGLTDVAVSATRDIIQVKLEGIDLADDPLLRDGFLHGTTVTVDVNKGSKLFDVTPYKNNIGIGIDEVLTTAGSVSLKSDGSLITRAGSTVNVSGGSIAYQGGYTGNTTKLLGSDGKVYDISTAPKTLNYAAVANSYAYTDPTWGTKSSASARTYYAGYDAGKSAGEIDVVAPQIYLRGSLQATTVAGLYQRSSSARPEGGTLAIGCDCTDDAQHTYYIAPEVIFSDHVTDTLGTATTLPDDLQASTTLSANEVTGSGFNQIKIYSTGAVTLPKGTNLNLAVDGSLSIKSEKSIDIEGNIDAPGASVALSTTAVELSTPPAHDINLGEGSRIDVSGNWVNDSPLVTTVPGIGSTSVNGGSVTLSAAGNVMLGDDSTTDVSGGGWVNGSNTLKAGAAGGITLRANYSDVTTGFHVGVVDLGQGASLLGNSLAAGGGGSLSLESGSVTVGTRAADIPGELFLNPDFFSNRGFKSYSITGQDRVILGSADPNDRGTVTIAPIQENWMFTRNMLNQPTGTKLSDFTTLTALPPSQRSPASIGFYTSASSAKSGSINTGDILLSRYASIVTDPGANVTLEAKGYTANITVLGSIAAPAGAIKIELGDPGGALGGAGDPGYLAGQRLLLGSDAKLDASAYPQIDTLNPLGYRQGTILAGGSISLLASKGYVVTDSGSLIKVDGAASSIDLAGSRGVSATTVYGNAGTIDIEAREGMVLEGDLSGQAAAVPGAGAGTLILGLDLNSNYNSVAITNANPTLTTPYSLNARTLTLSERTPPVLGNELSSGSALISESTIAHGGFDNVTLRSADVIAVDGDVSLSTKASLTLDAPLLRGGAGASLELSSAHVSLGFHDNGNQQDYFDQSEPGVYRNPNAALVESPGCAAPQPCTATLSVDAQLIDIRGISGWTGFAGESLTSGGDIRLTNADKYFGNTNQPSFAAQLGTSGDLTLKAQQVYPTTETDFTISAANSVTILKSSGTGSTPLSAGGTLTINAPTIDQEGVLIAPFGTITLNADDITLAAGSTTSVSANGTLIPYGLTSNGNEWTYSPAPGVTEVITAPSSKTVNLNGAHVEIDKGATVNLSGGGDVYAYEWIAGGGGSKDVLSTASGTYTYAVVPSLGSSYSPIDSQYQQDSTTTTPNRSVYLSGVPGLKDGWYALLPTRYALLPGAFAVQVVKSNSDLVQGSSVKQPDGSYIVAGRFGVAGTDIADGRTSTILIAPDSVVRAESKYSDSYADTFFSSAAAAAGTAAPRLPVDAGVLAISASTGLILDGIIDFAAGSYTTTDSSGHSVTTEGAGGQVSIQAPNIRVVDSGTSGMPSVGGALELDAKSLNDLGAQTVILGATAGFTPSGERIDDAITERIELDNASVALTAPEIILAAKNEIQVDEGAQIDAKGKLNQSPATLLVNGAGAVLRASSGGLTTVAVNTAAGALPQNPAGHIAIDSGANLSAAGSLLLYSVGDTTAGENAVLAAPALGLYSSRVSLGDIPTGTEVPGGLNLTTQLLGTLGGLTNLTIGSSSTIDFYGKVDLGTASSADPGLRSITLDAASLDGYDTGNSKSDVTLQAGAITFENSNHAGLTYSNAANPAGTGSLTLTTAAADATQTGRITLGAGDKAISGFGAVALTAAGDIQAQGTGTLNISSAGNPAVPLTLTSAAVTAASGSDQTVTASGAVAIKQAASSPVSLPTAPLGGKLAIEGSEIAQSGTIDLPAGIVTLHATGAGGITLANGSSTNAAGVAENYVVTDAVAAGGAINLIADQGNVSLAAGSTLNVSGAMSADGKVSGDAGSVTVSAPKGQFTFAGSTLKGGAAAGKNQGNFTLDVGSGLGGNSGPNGSGFSDLDRMLANSGFTGALALRTRGDAAVAVTDTLKASSFQLSVDQGSIELSGSIDTSGGDATSTDGGRIALWAGTGLTLDAGAVLRADGGSAGPVATNGVAKAARGGDITLGTAGGDIRIIGGTGANSTIISARGGGDAGTDGTLTLRAPRTQDGTDVQIQTQPENVANIQIGTRKAIIIEGVKTYSAVNLGSDDSGCGAGGNCDVADMNGVLFTDAQTFIGGSASTVARLGFSNANTVQVRAGIEVDSTGNLVVGDGNTTAWDLNSWNTALDAPVNVTLRAQKNLIFNASLSDGFTNSRGSQDVTSWTLGESAPTNVNSASYRLTGGADLAAANPLSTAAQKISPATDSDSINAPATGNVIVTPTNLIRTGDGNIDIAAGGDLLLGFNYTDADSNGNVKIAVPADTLKSTIYTAGVKSVLSGDESARFSDPTRPNRFTASYGIDGGDITVSTANDVQSVPSAQLVTDWLWRRGNTSSTRTTSWWVVSSDFEQGIGALGGGDINLNAGGDIVNVSAVIPTTGRLLASTDTAPAELRIYGGGTLRVRANGDLKGGVYENDWGNASVSVDGSLTSGATIAQEIPAGDALDSQISPGTVIYPVILTGGGTFDVSGRSGVTLNMVGNSTVLPQSQINTNLVTGSGAYFYTYGSTGALNVQSSGGDVVLNNDVSNLPIGIRLQSGAAYDPSIGDAVSKSSYIMYPATVNVASLSGNIGVLGTDGVNLYPAAGGNLSLLSAGSITGSTSNDVASNFRLTVYEADPALWPSAFNPISTLPTDGFDITADLPRAPLHGNDTTTIDIVAKSGSISDSTMNFPKSANVIAGGTIYDLNYSGKNLHSSDVTLIEAGGDINYSTPTEPITNLLVNNGTGITVAGPGYVEVLAGGTLNLGDSIGIVTSANLNDSRLPATGASIISGAGFGANAGGGLRQPAYQAFINAYVAPDAAGNQSAYAKDLIAYMQQLDPVAYSNLSYGAALAAYQSLTSAQQLPFLTQILSNELSETGLAHTLEGASYDRGYKAINTLFPTTLNGKDLVYKGDIDLFYSQIKTERGGNINLLAPGGSVVVGVANPNSKLDLVKTRVGQIAAANLGVLVLGKGTIQGFADQSFVVNQSRMLTLEGGDIILWASNGDIAAGNGAKSVSATSPPVIQTDANGNVFVNPSNAVVGSGIGQLLSLPGDVAGLVNLIAPKGTVDAGDAGIRVAGNLNIAAVQVIGAGNISVTGTSSGVPTSDAGALAGALSGANSLGDTSKSAVDELTRDLGPADSFQQMSDSLQPAFIVVKMFCLGVECEQR